jgi:hypothetical protein
VRRVAVHVSSVTSSFEKSVAMGGAGEVVRKDSENWRWKVRQEIGSTRVAEEASSESIERDRTRTGEGVGNKRDEWR